MRKKQTLKQAWILLLMLFFCGNSFALVTLSVSNKTIKQVIPQIEEEVDSNQNPSQSGNLIVVKGNVVDDKNEPLIGVSVEVKGGNNGTSTDIDGNYEIKVAQNATLVFSYIGSITQEIEVKGQTTINVVMQEDAHGLEEVVVIGYGAVKKKDLTGSVGAVRGEDLAVKKTTSLSRALQGSVAGLMVRRSDNAPGSSAGSMHIRGVTTIGNSSPLVIVDGVPGNIDYVNPNDVESVSVLKDAASASIYGSRAAAGVIVVTTKRASQTDLTFTYNGEFGVEIPTQQPGVVGVNRYLEMSNELRYNDTPTGGFFQAFSADQVKNWMKYNATDPNNYPVTDWRDLILKGSAPRQSHSIHISGGNKSVRTKASLSYDDVDGLYADRYFQRYMLRVNNDFTINKLLGAKLDLNIRRAKNHTPNYSPFGTMRNMPAIYAAMWDDGRIAEGKSGGNPYGLMVMGGSSDSWSTQIGGRGAIEFKPFTGFSLEASVAPFINYTKTKAFKKQAYYTLASDPDAFGGYLDEGGNRWETNKLNETRNDNYNVTSQLIANYMKTIGKHSLSLMGGFENYYSKSENLSASRDHYILTQYPYLDLGSEDYRDNGGNANEYTYNSYFGRLMYNYDSKYLLQANIRRDGSSRFAKKYRWGTFPSVSAGWVMSEEAFMKSLNLNWLSFLKLKGSWGQLGNERIGDFPYIALLSFSNALFYENGELVTHQTASQRELAVQDISWETTESTNIGVDLGFLNNRLRMTAEYYWKKTKDMLLTTQIPLHMGYSNPSTNQGKMSTKGFDLEVSWNDKKGDWTYGISANLSDFISKIDYLQNTKNISGGKIQVAGVGFNEWYGYICEGIYQTQEQVDNSAVLNDKIKVGDLWYRDISGPDGVPDGKISPEYDRVPLGNSLPRFQYGGNINVGYKGFDMSLTFQGIGKQNVRMAPEMIQPLRSNYGNIPDIYDGNYWSLFNTEEQNASAKYPRLTNTNADSNHTISDFWLFNGRYFRLKNLTFGYTLPKALTEKVSMKKVRVYASASDLFCISDYPSGWDPEMGTSSYPITTSLVFGLSVNF